MLRAFLLIAWVAWSSWSGAAEPSAKEQFGSVTTPSAGVGPTAIGGYAKGCLAGGLALPVNGPAWQAMRLSRNRIWGHSELVGFIERLGIAARADGWPGLLVGDMAQPRGGPMRSGHASHQIGLDVDLWLVPMPDRTLTAEEREKLVAPSMLMDGTRTADPARFADAQIALIRRAASDPAVERIFVHPGLKQAMCARVKGDRAWLGKVRPWWGHDDHFHVRLACPVGEPMCRGQDPPAEGDGCGADLAWWLTDEPWKPKPPGPPPIPLALKDLPAACAVVLRARGTGTAG
jgi:penicillin-insensitive murein DD-endopeptidase